MLEGVTPDLRTLLSQTAEYALRVMTVLALHEPNESVLTRDLSLESRVPGQYLSKILRRLVLAGLLESRKGRGGGFVLSRPAKAIAFAEVLAAVDAFPRESRCAFGWGPCDASHVCPLHASWTEMSEHFRLWASTSTLADVRGPSGGTARRKRAVKQPKRRPPRARSGSAQ